jgi:hypothetical protein
MRPFIEPLKTRVFWDAVRRWPTFGVFGVAFSTGISSVFSPASTVMVTRFLGEAGLGQLLSMCSR